MSKYTFGFIGCGNMGSALALAASKIIPTEELAVCDTDTSKTAALVNDGKATLSEVGEIASQSKYIFLAVKPQGLSALFAQIRYILQKRSDRFVLVSMAAGATIALIREFSGCDCPIIRMMPNTPVSVGEGMILYTPDSFATAEDVEGFLWGLSCAGKFDRVPESLMDAGGALSGCGPAFVYLFAEAMADGGVECGLPRDKATLYAAQTLLGAAKMLLDSGKHSAALKDAVCSPGGTTIAGVHELESGGVRASVMNAVDAAYAKTLKM